MYLIKKLGAGMEYGFKKLVCQILDITDRSYSNFKKQNRPIIKLFEKYFTKKDLEEFLETGVIKRQEYFEHVSRLQDTIVDFLVREFKNINQLKTMLCLVTEAGDWRIKNNNLERLDYLSYQDVENYFFTLEEERQQRYIQSLHIVAKYQSVLAFIYYSKEDILDYASTYYIR